MTRTALYPSFYWGDLRVDEYPFSVEFGSSPGSPESVMEVVTSLVQDGDIVAATRDNNRELTFTVLVEGADLGRVAEAEADLRRECLRPTNTFTVDPGDGFGPPTVFETYAGQMVLDRDDVHEQHGVRRWQVTVPAAPHVRSQNLTTISTLTTGSGGVLLIDDCSSATGWTGQRGSMPVTASTIWEAGAVGIMELDSAITSPERWTLRRTGTVDFSTMPYLVVEARTVSPVEDFLHVTVNGAGSVTLTPQSMRALSDPGWFQYVYNMPGGSWDNVEFSHTSGPRETWQGLLVRHVIQRDSPSALARQQTRFLEIRGTERTPASLRLSAPDGSTPLGLALIHTSPDDGTGYTPNMRQWRVSGNAEVIDLGTISGKREPIGPSFVISDVPITSLAKGGYQMMMLARASAAGTYRVEATIQSVQGALVLGESTWAEDVEFPAANTWQIVPMGLHSVPIVAAKSGVFRIAFRTPSTTVVEYDEAWLFSMSDDAALTIARLTTPYLWLDSADIENRVPRLWQGTQSDKSDARYPDDLHAPGHHVFKAGWMRIYTAVQGVDWTSVELSYYKRWHTHAAED